MLKFVRRRNRLPKQAYVGRHWYFITICTCDGCPILSNVRLVELLLGILREGCGAYSFGLYAYCFMPDHLHLELAGLSDNSDLIALIRKFKGVSATRGRKAGFFSLWQKGFYDHILRPGDGEDRVARYIFNNPVRKELATDMWQWPHSGSWMFDWKTWRVPLDDFVPPWKAATDS